MPGGTPPRGTTQAKRPALRSPNCTNRGTCSSAEQASLRDGERPPEGQQSSELAAREFGIGRTGRPSVWFSNVQAATSRQSDVSGGHKPYAVPAKPNNPVSATPKAKHPWRLNGPRRESEHAPRGTAIMAPPDRAAGDKPYAVPAKPNNPVSATPKAKHPWRLNGPRRESEHAPGGTAIRPPPDRATREAMPVEQSKPNRTMHLVPRRRQSIRGV